ncbi:MAG: hypothetical protein M3P30_14770 [Chloroflexota bacterium]|nr:hypothetical protein [Chloroflexota bacterium]
MRRTLTRLPDGTWSRPDLWWDVVDDAAHGHERDHIAASEGLSRTVVDRVLKAYPRDRGALPPLPTTPEELDAWRVASGRLPVAEERAATEANSYTLEEYLAARAEGGDAVARDNLALLGLTVTDEGLV